MPLRKYSDDPPSSDAETQTLVMESQALVQAIKPILAGHRAEAQGAALADLLSLWIAGHMVAGNAPETDSFRAFILNQHINLVRALIPTSEKEILANVKTEGSA